MKQALLRARPESNTRCGCSGGGGSMARVWGAMAPARLVLLLLLMALCSREVRAAPLREPRAARLAQFVEWNPVPEPGVDSTDVNGVEWDPASQLPSGSEGPADGMEVPPWRALPNPQLVHRWRPTGLETRKEELDRGKNSPVLKEMKKDWKKAAPGLDAGKFTKAAVGNELREDHIPVIAVVLAVLLSVLMLACPPMVWMWKKYLAHKREETAEGQAQPDTNRERDQKGDKGRAELGEAAKEGVLAQGNNTCSPFSRSFEEQFAELCRRISTDPSLQPTSPQLSH